MNGAKDNVGRPARMVAEFMQRCVGPVLAGAFLIAAFSSCSLEDSISECGSSGVRGIGDTLTNVAKSLVGTRKSQGPPGCASTGQFIDQGHITFDDTGNIVAVVNNIEFKTNPLFNETSFIGVSIFERGANPFIRCCSGSTCPAAEAASCLRGVGFSNDLAFAGTYYIDLHPPRIFDKNADRYYMQVYAAGKDGIPDNYQGEYNTFSSSTGPIGDHVVFDAYIGVYYSVFAPGIYPHRVMNQTKTFGTDAIYLPVSPDFLSPVIQIESRFFPESEGDPPGSWFPIPSMASWTRILTIPTFEDFRGKVLINEIVYDAGYTAASDGTAADPEWIEIINNSGKTISMYGWRFSTSARPSVDLGITAGSTFLASTAVPAGARILIGYFNTGVTPACGAACSMFNGGAATSFSPDTDFSDGFVVIRINDSDATGMSTDSSARLYQDAGQTIIDYIEWTVGATSATCGDETSASTAANAGIWTTGDCVKSSGNPNIWGIKRSPDAADTNTSADWQICTEAKPNAAPTCFTPGAVNN